ncbi:MAG: nucleotidyl transferase AbiEii/AbiGii toxin family protein [Oscillospiraceae bacterium]|nr:nucleotidyl transferase AbiEii/AbiGii toxin family protein [Oscillospiraceae bacterium]
MLLRENFTEEHIRELQKTSRRDPILLERTVYAFGLLEALARVGMPFVFKGGTCLMLLLEHPMRLSTDIDIVVEPGIDVDDYVRKASELFPFVDYEEQKRKGRNNIEKRHFQFLYDSPINEEPFYILLDILFEEDHYARLIEKPIKNELLMTDDTNPVMVRIPSPACILGDKLTAFAPHTTGIPLHQNKDMEVMKQFYDVCTLIDVLDDFDDLKNTYAQVSASEIEYRGTEITPSDCLHDTIRAPVSIASRGKTDEDDYAAYLRGSRDLRTHIFSENFSAEIASSRAARIIYLAATLLSNTSFEFVTGDEVMSLVHEKLTQDVLMPLARTKKVNPEGYAYLVKADRLLSRV